MNIRVVAADGYRRSVMERLKADSQVETVVMRQGRVDRGLSTGAPSRRLEPDDARHQAEAGEEDQSACDPDAVA